MGAEMIPIQVSPNICSVPKLERIIISVMASSVEHLFDFVFEGWVNVGKKYIH